MTTDELTQVEQDARESQERVFGPYIVAFIDFLGQSSELAKWDFVPATHELGGRWLHAVEDSVLRILQWRREFETAFKLFTDSLGVSVREGSAIAAATDSASSGEAGSPSPIKCAHFSDSIIIYAHLLKVNHHPEINSLCGILAACGMLMLLSLVKKTVYRGGIEIGMLGRLPTGEPYGPALAKAYKLESKCADYPRILVGPLLREHLNALADRGGEPSLAPEDLATAQLCRQYIAQDADDCWIVDYLNDAFANAGDSVGWRKMQTDAFAFVRSELARFRQSDNEKLAKRYERLQAYFTLRGSEPAATGEPHARPGARDAS